MFVFLFLFLCVCVCVPGLVLVLGGFPGIAPSLKLFLHILSPARRPPPIQDREVCVQDMVKVGDNPYAADVLLLRLPCAICERMQKHPSMVLVTLPYVAQQLGVELRERVVQPKASVATSGFEADLDEDAERMESEGQAPGLNMKTPTTL